MGRSQKVWADGMRPPSSKPSSGAAPPLITRAMRKLRDCHTSLNLGAHIHALPTGVLSSETGGGFEKPSSCIHPLACSRCCCCRSSR